MNLEKSPAITVNGTANDQKFPMKDPIFFSGSDPARNPSNTGVSNSQRIANFKKIDSIISTKYKSKTDLKKIGSKESLECSRSQSKRKSPKGRSTSREITKRLPGKTPGKAFNSQHILPSVTARNLQNQTSGQGNILIEETSNRNNVFGVKTRTFNMNRSGSHNNRKLQKKYAKAENNGNAPLWMGTDSGESAGNISEIQKSITKPAQASIRYSMNDGPMLTHSVSGKFKTKRGLPNQKSIKGLNIMGRKRSSNHDTRMPGFKCGPAPGLQTSSTNGRLFPLTERASPDLLTGSLTMRGKLSNQQTIMTERESTTGGVEKFLPDEPRMIQKNTSMQLIKKISYKGNQNVTNPNFLNMNSNI
jgi:hypothetical protein